MLVIPSVVIGIVCVGVVYFSCALSSVFARYYLCASLLHRSGRRNFVKTLASRRRDW